MTTRTTCLTAQMLALALAGAGCASDVGELLPPTVDEDPSLPAVDLNGTRLHLETFGDEGDPVVVVLHGGPGGDIRSLEHVADLAADGYFVVLWDQRGAGLSRRHDCDELTEDDYLADLEALVDRFAPADGPPLLVVGHSWGAMYATWYMNEHPERVRAAVLVEPGGLTEAEVDEYFGELVGIDPVAEELSDALWTARALTPDDHARADLLNALMYDAVRRPLGMRESDPAPFSRSGGYVARCLPESAGHFDWTTDLDDVTAEILFLHGDRNQVSPPARQRRIAAHYRDAEVREIAGTGHDLHWAMHDAFVDITREHFDAALAR